MKDLSENMISNLKREADYFQLPNMIEDAKDTPNFPQGDSEETKKQETNKKQETGNKESDQEYNSPLWKRDSTVENLAETVLRSHNNHPGLREYFQHFNMLNTRRPPY